jgi:hypothetical protein
LQRYPHRSSGIIEVHEPRNRCQLISDYRLIRSQQITVALC